MTPQERDLLTTLLDRLKSTAVPGQPKDPDADRLIRQAVAERPDMPYYLVQTVLIQDLSLHQAQARIAELEQQLADANASQSQPTSFLGRLLGGGQSAQPSGSGGATAGPWSRGPNVAPPPAQQGAPQYAQPGYAQPGYAQPGSAPGVGMLGGAGGGGFLRSAAATAAGVAGGALLFQGISSMFGHGYANSLYGGMGGMTPGLGETVINNYYGDSSGGGDDYGGGSDFGSGGGGGGGGGGDVGGGRDVHRGR